jgi:lipoprotein signal peptidase
VNYRKFIFLFLIFVVGLTADILTKRMVTHNIKGQSAITIIDGYLEFSYVENRGMVFGFLNDENTGIKRYALTALTFVSIVVIVSLIWKMRELAFIYLLPFFMILAGAFGNVIDRIRFGHVIDFIHMFWQDKLDYPWLYNVADALVVVGMIFLMILFLFKNDVYESVAAKKETLRSE